MDQSISRFGAFWVTLCGLFQVMLGGAFGADMDVARARSLKEAIANHRQLRRDLAELERISRRIMFRTSPHPARRKLLTNKVLGLN